MKKFFIFCFTFKKGAVLRLSECSHMTRHNTKELFVSNFYQNMGGNRIGCFHKNTKYGHKNANQDIYIDKTKRVGTDALYLISIKNRAYRIRVFTIFSRVTFALSLHDFSAPPIHISANEYTAIINNVLPFKGIFTN
ncbi:MAG: hypothetical protein K2I81_03600 [Alphaproteobacteria bacterium]|nr:hypothetical protein [Alphaproteobacteria bacterium]